MLQREEAASPVKLEQAAKRLGMQPLQAAQIDPLLQAANIAREKANAQSKENGTKPNAKPGTKTITKVPLPTPGKPSRQKPI
jgi:hypothetical protein